jgi:hypothetical protein
MTTSVAGGAAAAASGNNTSGANYQPRVEGLIRRNTKKAYTYMAN